MSKLPITMLMIGTALTIGCSAGSTQRATATPPPEVVQANTEQAGVIPAGTTFSIRTNEAISSEQPRETYSAEVAQTITNQSGKLLVPKGSPAELAIAQISKGGTVGTPTMELVIRSINVNGREYQITTEASEQQGEEGLGKNRRTAEMVGGGALLGTLIGAVAGGGKGAAIGAAVGAAGGATAQVLTRGNKVQVPAETLLTFRLSQPWRLRSV